MPTMMHSATAAASVGGQSCWPCWMDVSEGILKIVAESEMVCSGLVWSKGVVRVTCIRQVGQEGSLGMQTGLRRSCLDSPLVTAILLYFVLKPLPLHFT